MPCQEYYTVKNSGVLVPTLFAVFFFSPNQEVLTHQKVTGIFGLKIEGPGSSV